MQVVLQTGEDDPLDKEAELHDQMESIPFLCRYQYDRSCPYICQKLDPIMDAFAKCNPLSFSFSSKTHKQQRDLGVWWQEA